MIDFKGKSAVITGGASGIGLGIATELAKRGCNIAITDLNEKKGRAVVKELAKEGIKTLFVHHDISKEESWDDVIDVLKSDFPPVDFAFNNAGVMLQPKPLQEVSVKDWQWLFSVNQWGTLFGLRKFTELMEEQDIDGRIITTASAASISITSGWVPYCVTKVAVLRMVEGYQAEANLLGKTKIKYSVVMPAVVYSNIGNSETYRLPEFATSDVPAVEQPNIQPGTPEGNALGMITTEVAVERILEQVSSGLTYIYTHMEVSKQGVYAEAASMIFNNPPFDTAALNPEIMGGQMPEK